MQHSVIHTESDNEKIKYASQVSHREPVRRIGSGRILTRDIWDFRSDNEKIEPERADYGFRSGTTAGGSLRDRDSRDNRDGKERDSMRDRDRDRDNLRERDDRFERRTFGRDYGDRERERDRDRGGAERSERNHQVQERDKDRGRERRYSNNDRRRTYSDNRESDEPEWFSSGPTSQHDTIELRGFEDIPEEKAVNCGGNSNAKSKKQTPAQKKRAKKNATEKEDKSSENSSGPKGRSTPTAMDQSMNAVPAPHSPISEQTEQSSIAQKENNVNESTVNEPVSESTENSKNNQNQEDTHPDFNLDEFLKSDTFPGVSGLLTVSSPSTLCALSFVRFERISE